MSKKEDFMTAMRAFSWKTMRDESALTQAHDAVFAYVAELEKERDAAIKEVEQVQALYAEEFERHIKTKVDHAWLRLRIEGSPKILVQFDDEGMLVNAATNSDTLRMVRSAGINSVYEVHAVPVESKTVEGKE